MKTSTLDLEELQVVNPTIVLEYLKSNSWVAVESKSTDQYLILKHLTPDKRDAFTLLPLDVEIPDFASRMFDLIKVVSIVEQRSQAEVFNSIKSAKEFAEEKDRDILNFKLKFKDVEQRELQATLLGELLISFQNLINGISGYYCKIPAIGRIPDKVISQSQVSVIGMYEGSFGLRLASKQPKVDQLDQQELDLLLKPLIRESFEELFKLVVASKEDENHLKETLVRLGNRVSSGYRKFLTTLQKTKTDNYLEWGSLDANLGASVEFKYQEVVRALEIVSKYVPEPPTEFEIFCRWVAGSERSKTFEIKDNDSGKTYKGEIDDSAFENVKELAKMSKSYNAVISEEISLNEATQEISFKYVLLSLRDPMSDTYSLPTIELDIN